MTCGKRLHHYFAVPLLMSSLSPGCGASEPGDGWLTGETEKRFEMIERQLRGLDVAMVEVGYRFGELYFAGKDRNWPHARYQIEKMESVIELALERRPNRAASARPFLEQDLPAVLEAVEREDEALFMDRMERLRAGCMRCHVEEEVPHFTVWFPEHRPSSIRPAP